jgi:glycosyltransferase involved in cell wall biosynthesis
MYTDILRAFTKNGHYVCSISPLERRYKGETKLIEEKNSKLLRLRIGNIQKTNLIEKGISTLAIEQQLINGIRKYFNDIKFDLVLYATPPITFCRVIKYVKERDGAFAYLMLKDIFPQNAVDLGMFKKTGVMSVVYKYFRAKETKLYALSDKIGCMSKANCDYLLTHNKEIPQDKVEICPNVIEVQDKSVDWEKRNSIRKKYSVPQDKVVFVYGGNLGKPQDIPFIVKCLKTQIDNDKVFFLIVGDGTEFPTLEEYYNNNSQHNFKLMKRLPKEDYDILVGACDVGMLFLDHRFTIPNFPSRLLSYMQAKLPVLACTDSNTDVGSTIIDGGFGWWCESNDVNAFSNLISTIRKEELAAKGEAAMAYLIKNYSESVAYKVIEKEFVK